MSKSIVLVGGKKACKRKREEVDEETDYKQKRQKLLVSKLASHAAKVPHVMIPISDMMINVTSASREDVLYAVVIQYVPDATGGNGVFQFACNCGSAYGIPVRDHCTHISTIIASMMKQYAQIFIGAPGTAALKPATDSSDTTTVATTTTSMSETDMEQLTVFFTNLMKIV